MTCEHHQPGLSPATIDDFAQEFDAVALAAMRADAEQLAAGTGPAAPAWRVVAVALTQAWEARDYEERAWRDRADRR